LPVSIHDQLSGGLHQQRVKHRHDLVARQVFGGKRVLELFEACALRRACRKFAAAYAVGQYRDLDVADPGAMEAGAACRALRRYRRHLHTARKSDGRCAAHNLPSCQRGHRQLLTWLETTQEITTLEQNKTLARSVYSATARISP
jgi:hypothetical protein